MTTLAGTGQRRRIEIGGENYCHRYARWQWSSRLRDLSARIALVGASLAGASLADANLRWARLAGASLAGASLAGANLRGADLADADLAGANLRGANLRGADLASASLAGANLRGANLASASLASASLCDADLTSANLAGVNLLGTNLAGARLADGLVINKTPIQIQTPMYWIIIFDNCMAIGCQFHLISDWFKFDDRKIIEMDNRHALKWWNQWKPLLHEICRVEERGGVGEMQQDDAP